MPFDIFSITLCTKLGFPYPMVLSLAYLSQPHFEASVRMKLALPKVGTWSPLGLLKRQRSIAGVKTPRFEVFFILLERS
jgi:hypothetical protein